MPSMDWFTMPPRAGMIDDFVQSLFSPNFFGVELLSVAPATANIAIGANTAIFHPFTTSAPAVISQFFWANGTVVDGNTDIGIYNEQGTALLVHTGPVLNSGTSQVQVADVADFRLPAARRLWLAIATDSATQQFNRFTLTAPIADFVGVKTMAAAWSSGLPSSVSFSAGSSTAIRCGFTGSSVF